MIRDNAQLEWLVRQGEEAVSGLLGQSFTVRERAASFQEAALAGLNLPTAAAVEMLMRRVLALSRRLETIEDGLADLPAQLRALPRADDLATITKELAAIRRRLDDAATLPEGVSNGSTVSGGAPG